MNNINIGLLTYHWVANYGANLQMYSTYMYLKNRGYTPIVINYIPQSAMEFYNFVSGKNQIKCHLNFLKSHCYITREFSELSEFNLILKEYNITHIIVGSDSLFNLIKPKFSLLHRKIVKVSEDHRFPNPFWCSNINIPHVALSVSSQNANYLDFKDIKDDICKSLLGFKKITVRDEWTKKMITFFTGGKIAPQVTPDPVFGFNYNVVSQNTPESIRKKFGLPEKYVLFTFNNGRMKASLNWINKIKHLFNQKGFACVYLPKATGGQKLRLDYEINMPIDPLDWYDLIRYSNGYVGVLMHPIVVCLHNVVPCYSFDHYGTGPILLAKKESSKIYHIMDKAKLLSNHYFLKNHLFYPSPEKVVERIIKFPYKEIEKFSFTQQKECIENLDNLLDHLVENNRERYTC